VHAPLDHDVRVWLSAEEYLGVLHTAEHCDRTLSGYVRHLAIRASALADAHARAETGLGRDE
jgi:hypothetical protein